MSSLADELKVYEEIKSRLLADHPDLDEETLLDTLEGATNLPDRILSICRAAREADAQAKVCASMIDDLDVRQKRHKARSEHLRSLALWAMQEASIPKIPAADMTITITKGRTSVVITDANALPLGFAEFEPKPNKALIKQALENGDVVSGASLSNGPDTLSIRTK